MRLKKLELSGETWRRLCRAWMGGRKPGRSEDLHPLSCPHSSLKGAPGCPGRQRRGGASIPEAWPRAAPSHQAQLQKPEVSPFPSFADDTKDRGHRQEFLLCTFFLYGAWSEPKPITGILLKEESSPTEPCPHASPCLLWSLTMDAKHPSPQHTHKWKNQLEKGCVSVSTTENFSKS